MFRGQFHKGFTPKFVLQNAKKGWRFKFSRSEQLKVTLRRSGGEVWTANPTTMPIKQLIML